MQWALGWIYSISLWGTPKGSRGCWVDLVKQHGGTIAIIMIVLLAVISSMVALILLLLSVFNLKSP